jgi:hypothetical protein
VDYLGYWLKQATIAWHTEYPGLDLPGVDIIAHSTGGLVARAYMQSNAYGDSYDANNPNLRLPKVDHFIMMGVPNQGAPGPWLQFNDQWGEDNQTYYVLAPLFEIAYRKVLGGVTIKGPDYNISKGLIDFPGTDTPSTKLFIQQYCPTLVSLLPTNPFVRSNSGQVLDLPDPENKFLEDLNDGSQWNAFTNPSWVKQVVDIYGYGQSTPTSINSVTSSTAQWTRYSMTGAVDESEDVPMQELISTPASGDGTVPTVSSVGLFIGNPNVKRFGFKNITHTSMFADPAVEGRVLFQLGSPVFGDQIVTGSTWASSFDTLQNVLSYIQDPVDAFLVDANGKRLGYSASTGALTEIPGSVYYGGADGMGFIFGLIAGPLQLTLTGANDDALVRVRAVEGSQNADTMFSGFLAAGQTQSSAVTFQGPEPATRFEVDAPADTPTGAPFSVTVSAQDDAGHLIADYIGTVDFASSDGLAGLPAEYTFTPDDHGVKTFANVVFNTGGSQTITVADKTDANIAGTAALAVGSAATHFSVSVPSSVSQGTSTSVVVTALDANNHVVAGYSGTVHFTSSDSLSSLPADFAFPAEAQGQIVFTVILNTLGTQTLLVADGANSSIKGNTSANVVAGVIATTSPLPGYSAPNFKVSWSGMDVSQGGGIAFFDVYVSDNGGPFSLWQQGTSATSAVYSGNIGHTYGFYVTALDYQGNQSVAPFTAQASTQTLLTTPNQQYVDAVYLDLLGRDPDLTGLSYWSGQLDGGADRGALINQITHSAEYFGTIIKPAYLKFLGRAADAGGLKYWTDQMIHGLTDEQLEAGFIGSPEYYQHSGGTDKGWVDAMYENLLGRHPDPGGESYWTGQLAHGASRSGVALGFAASAERESQHIQANYQKYLVRTAGPSEVAYWLQYFANGGSNENIIAGFVASDEYYQEHS